MNREFVFSVLIRAIKIAIGSCIANFIATSLNLNFATSAGIIALLSILTTKWETVKISLFRVLSFAFSVVIALGTIQFIKVQWIEFGVFIFLLVVICEFIGWQATISVNAVIGTHFLTTLDFSAAAILNEFLLVVIGITIAVILNLFQNNGNAKKKIINNIQYTEERMRYIMGELAMYMRLEKLDHSVWEDIVNLERDLGTFVEYTYKYQNNTFQSHPSYYIHYFEMRTQQCNVLHNLHYQMKSLRYMPKQALVIADYISYMKDYVVENNAPAKQLNKLEQIFIDMKQEPLPESREEFENRAILYHILQDLREFLVFKERFVEGLDSVHKNIYWRNKD